MRTIANLNANWLFTKTDDDAFARPGADTSAFEAIDLPHTWNNFDGQDGGADYFRGRCWYRKELPGIPAGKVAYVEFEGANHIAEVYCNGALVTRHEGGFSTFRADLTPHLRAGENLLAVSVDNGESHVYPQMADFSFCGGLYRDARLIVCEPAHFDLDKYGSAGVFVTAAPDGAGATVRVDAFAVNAEGCTVHCVIVDPDGNPAAELSASGAHSVLETRLETARLWNGRKDPALYAARLTLSKDGAVADEVTVSFGIRSFSVDPEKGFILNGQSCPLHGVAKHQDRFNKGWATSRGDLDEDMALICEVGANTVRLAHYQHPQYFYELCDRNGIVAWAEIPFISVFDDSPEARENTLSQMTELVVQNYNHPAICFWGIANEITIGDDNEALLRNLQDLNALVKKLDPSRLTTIANVSMLEEDSPHNRLTDVVAYNHYFGWYGGTVEQNGPWFDNFHQQLPNRPLAISEYGAEAILKWHSETPKVQDYTEEYQAWYHEKMLETFSSRPYLWATYVWNMFDFAADARDEGGCRGRNNKGLVTYDRGIRKDSFYAYKAWWSDEPFVHIAGRRFRDRVSGTSVKVYANCGAVTLTLNGSELGEAAGAHVFVFENVPLAEGVNTLTATGDNGQSDTITLVGVRENNPDYILPRPESTGDGPSNWFAAKTPEHSELQFSEGYYSVRDTLNDLLENAETGAILMGAMSAVIGGTDAGGGTMVKMAIKMLGKKSLETLFQMGGDRFPENALLLLNEELTKIKKP